MELKPHTARMIEMFDDGKCLDDIASETGIPRRIVVSRLRWHGRRYRTRDDMHPLSRTRRQQIGAFVGSVESVSHDAAELIAADVAKHGGTVWDAVSRLVMK